MDGRIIKMKTEREKMMNSFTNNFMANDENRRLAEADMMGPNAMRLSEEMASFLEIEEGMRILDLGCGCGLSTRLLAEKYGATVFAADLWISPTDNHNRFQAAGITDKAIPIFADATEKLPFAEGYFDMLFSVGAYQYFGDRAETLPSLIPYVKKGGVIAVAVNGIKYEFGEAVPDELRPFWNPEVARTIHSLDWWKQLWENEKGIELMEVREMSSCAQAWEEWLAGYHPDLPFAKVLAESKKMMKAEAGKYYNVIQLIARVL